MTAANVIPLPERPETEPVIDPVSEMLGALKTEIQHLRQDVAEVKADLQPLVDLRKKGVGFLVAVTLFGSLIVMGAAQIVRGWFAP